VKKPSLKLKTNQSEKCTTHRS